MSGHHENIAAWRRNQRLALTAKHRPDLLQIARGKGLLNLQDEKFLATNLPLSGPAQD